MPARPIPLVTEEIYHVFNRGIDHRPTFTDQREHQRTMEIIKFYRFVSPPIKLSRFLTITQELKMKILEQIEKSGKLIDIISFSFMPNHFHFLLKQKIERGIANFISQFQNSYTRYFNTKHERVGPLFLDQFKAVRIETDEQLTHVSRYIHLNPYSSYVVKSLKDLQFYPWSSLKEFITEDNEEICDKDIVLSLFRDKEDYKKFVFNQADYQRELEKIKHLVFE